MKLLKNFREVQKNITDSWWRHRRLEDRVIKPIHRSVYDPKGIDVIKKDWDNLMILDACRADLFEDVAPMEEFDQYQTVTSGGSGTPEWIKYNFKGEQFGDVVYITANPWPVKLVPDVFHKIVDLTDRWEDDVVTADTVAETARRTIKKKPNKRIIIHFMQPHAPFVTENDLPADFRSVGREMKRGRISKNDAYNAYAKNLEHVLRPTIELADDLLGKTAITSDHGEMIGERAEPVPIRMWGHSPGVRTHQLNNVPWAEINGESRRRIVDDGVSDIRQPKEDEIDKRLAALGYKGGDKDY